MSTTTMRVCENWIILWPDQEQIVLRCIREAGHEGRCTDDLERGNSWVGEDVETHLEWWQG